jgi:hypothetical protein
MANSLALTSTQPPVPVQPLACRLQRKHVVGRRGPVPFMAEIELENLSGLPIEIEYRMTALQYLSLVVRDSQGKQVSDEHFGDRFAPTCDPNFLRLGPGEKFHANVHLFATMPRGPIAPGTYQVQAVYEYNGFRSESEPEEVTVD